MQARLERGKAAFPSRSVGSSVVILAAPLIGALGLCAPDLALAACGGASHPAHAAATSGGSVHTATSISAPSGGGGGGGGSLGCANGSSASGLGRLPTAASGRVMEPGVHAARNESHARTATSRTSNASAHLRTVRPAHHG
jgi:hypothetical protein